ncbi:MAG: RecX family transcriptional regulator [Actinomycetia bacterium]|nr:RecX family transcriptional regulator [Actinomycetes bacterium]
MRRWGYHSDVVDEVVVYLQSKGLIDDVVLATLLVEEMLRKGYGCRRVRDGLVKKKLEMELIKEVMAGYPYHREVERAGEVAALRVSRMPGDEPVTRRVKIKRYLIRQGYSPEVADEVCRSDIIDTQTGPEYN